MEKMPEFGMVGTASEESKEEILEKIQGRFIKQEDQLSEERLKEVHENESIKTPEQLHIIDFINEETNKLMIEAGVEPFDIPYKNIHILQDEFLKKNGVPSQGSFQQNNQSIFLPASLNELKKRREKLLKELEKSKTKTKALDKLAVWITNRVGSMGFFVVIFIWTAIWLSWNILAPKTWRYDPYPGFVLWLFVSNMIQLFLMPLIMIGQNVDAKQSNLRAEVDLKINAQAEIEIETILIHLERQNKIMLKLLKHIEGTKATNNIQNHG